MDPNQGGIMTTEHWIYTYLICAGFWGAYKMGRWYEREEVPRNKMAKEMRRREDGALGMIAACYVENGDGHTYVETTLDSMSDLFPAVRMRWHSLKEGDRQKLGAETLVKLADPKVQAEFEAAHLERERLVKDLMVDARASFGKDS